MKKLRFLIAIVLIFSLLPIFGVSATEQTDEVKATETYAFKKLEAFGFMSETDPMFYYENVKRNMFISYMMKCCPGYMATAPVDGIENPFADVTDKTEFANDISAAAYVGIISGTKGSNFRPEEFITKSEVAKVFVAMLGYSEYAERKGGYPFGYVAMAESLGLFDGCEFSPEGYLTVKGFLKAFGNLLDTDVLEVRSITLDAAGNAVSQTYQALEENTLLHSTFGIYQAKGVIESNEYTSLYATSTLEPGEVKINDYVYKINGTNAGSLIGYNTHYYYKKAKDAIHSELVFVEPYRNNVVNTTTNYIIKDAVTPTNFRYYVDENSGRYYDLTISDSATLMFNGEIKPVTKENLCPANGTVTLIDNNDDKIYDVISIMDYRTIVISSVSPTDYKVMDSFNGRPIELDPEAEDYDVIMEVKQPVSKDTYYDVAYERYGEYLPPVKNEFSELKAGDTILYAASENNNRNLKHVKVSRDVVEGKVSAANQSKNYVVIDDQKYEVGPVMIETAQLGEDGQELKDEEGNVLYHIVKKDFSVAIGDQGTFYLDVFGRIVAQSVGNKTVYGYLSDISKETNVFGTVVRIHMFSENGRWLDLELAKKVRTNAASEDLATFESKEASDVYDALNNKPQLLTYTVNKDGKINSIAVAQAVEAYSDEEQEAMSKDIFRAVYSSTWETTRNNCQVKADNSYSYVGKSLSFTDIQIDDASRIFVICEDNPDLIRIEPKTKIITDMGDGTFIPYDLNERRIANAVLMFKKEEDYKVVYSNPLLFVKAIVTATNINGDLVNGIECLRNGEVVTYLASGKAISDVIANLSVGDIVQVSLNQNGEIYNTPPHKHSATETSITVNLDLGVSSERGAVIRRFSVEDWKSGANKLNRFMTVTSGDSSYGDVCTVDFVDALGSRVLVTGSGNKKGFLGVKAATKYYIYDTQKVELKDATLADLGQGIFCFIKRMDYVASAIYIIK